MNPAPMNVVRAKAHPAPDPLTDEIKSLVAKLHKDERGVYVRLVELGRRDPNAGEPEEFYHRLRQGGLRKERASEIRAILENQEVADEFIAQLKPGEKGLGVKAALQKARGPPGQKGQKSRGTGIQGSVPDEFTRQLSRTLDRLVLLMDRQKTYSLDGEAFQFRYSPLSRTEPNGIMFHRRNPENVPPS